MNILYIDHYAGSPQMGMEFRPYYLSREWVKLGHKVIIIAGDYSHLRKVNPTVTHDFQTETIDGIEYVWLISGTYDGNGVARALTMERFVRKIFTTAHKIVRRWQPDVVIASSTYPLDTWSAQRVAKIAKCKYVHEVHDMWPATLYEVGGMSKIHPFVVLMQIAENSAYKHCDKCVALMPYSKDYMVKHGLRPDKFVNIQNGIVEEEWEKADKIPLAHKDFFIHHGSNFIVGYFGGHALSNSLDTLLDTAKLMKGSNVIFVLVGNGVEKKRLIKRKEDENINNLYFLDQINKREVPDLITYFDCSVIVGTTSPIYRFGVCLNKMYDAMMAGKPLVTAIGTSRTIVDEYGCGINVSSVSPEDIKNSIEIIQNMSLEEREEMGRKGRKAVLEHYTYSHLAELFLVAMS